MAEQIPDNEKRVIAEGFIAAAKALKRAQSSVKWFAEVRDTVDGKPVQAIANPEGEKFQVEVVTLRGVDFSVIECAP